jgi:hypothetical protein
MPIKLIARTREILSQRRAARAVARAREAEILAAIEHVVDEVNPKLRAISSYRKQLKQPVERALAYSAEIVTSIPGPVEVNRTAWSKDPMVRAFFTGIEDMCDVLSSNREVRDFLDGSDATEQQHCYALLSMQRSERTVTGVEGSGDIIKRDVLQTSVSFRDHRVVKPGASESQLRQELEARAFEVLVAYVLERITMLIARRQSLKEKQLLLDMQLRHAQVKKASLSPLLESGGNKAADIEALQQHQQHMTQELEQAGAKLTTLDDYIDRISEVLGNPEGHFRVNRIRMRLSQMNIKRDEKSSGSGHDLELTEALLGDQLQRILLIIKFPRDELLERERP